MITKEQYEEYKRLVVEYEEAEYEDRTREAERELNFDEEEEDRDPYCDDCGQLAWKCRCELIAASYSCKCGAVTHDGRIVADCCCGAI